MPADELTNVNTLTFDIFGTVLDLSGSIIPPLADFLRERNASIDGETLWPKWRARQRIEQHQDTILMLGHRGYLDSARRALVYCLRNHKVEFNQAAVESFMRVFENLRPYDDAVEGLHRLGEQYRLVALSNGDTWLLEHLIDTRIPAPFDRTISVDRVGRFKPHPSVYRTALQILEAEPAEVMMVAAHSFDILGARACGFRGAFVNRYELPYETSTLQPDWVGTDFLELADHMQGEARL